MLNMKDIDNRPNELADNLARRGLADPFAPMLPLRAEQQALNREIEALNASANRGAATAADKARRQGLENRKREVDAQMQGLLLRLPNLLHPTVPDGKGAADNPVQREGGMDLTAFADAQAYLDTAVRYGLDGPAGAAVAGARFTVMRGEIARLHRRLVQAALDFYGARGYEECYVPVLVNGEAIEGTGQLPKFAEEVFTTEHGNHPLYLIPTGEVPLTNLVANRIWPQAQAAQAFMAATPCFRKEAGAAGRDTRGIIRQHQFEKVELVRTCEPEQGLTTLDGMVDDVIAFVETLPLRYRVVELCAGDIGFAGHKAYDVEIWFPAEQVWREIASITWCADFQARRMKARFKRDNQNLFLHTLNGTGLAAGRVMAALLECHGEDALQWARGKQTV